MKTQLLALSLLCCSCWTQAQSKNVVEYTGTGTVWSDSYLLESKGEYKQAAALMLALQDHSDSKEMATLRLAWLLYLQGSYNQSADTYSQALKLNSLSIETRLGLMLPLMAQGRYKEALVYGKQVLELSKWNYLAHQRIMTCEAYLKQWDSLRKHALSVKVRYPSDATILVYLARAQVQLGQQADAKYTYAQVLQRYPEHLEANSFLNTK